MATTAGAPCAVTSSVPGRGCLYWPSPHRVVRAAIVPAVLIRPLHGPRVFGAVGILGAVGALLTFASSALATLGATTMDGTG